MVPKATPCAVFGCSGHCWDGKQVDDEWVCSRHFNQYRAWKHLFCRGQKGEAEAPLVRNGAGVLIENQAYDQRLSVNAGGGKSLGPKEVIEIRRRYGKEPTERLAREFGVTPLTIRRTGTRKRWAGV